MPTNPITRSQPRVPMLGDLDALENRLERWMSQFFTPGAGGTMGSWAPAVELVEHDGEYVVTAELAGVRKEDIDLDLSDNVLTIRGHKREETRPEGTNKRVWERWYGEFERSFSLPRQVDAGKVRAEYKDGVLTIHVPKSTNGGGRKIKIAEG